MRIRFLYGIILAERKILNLSYEWSYRYMKNKRSIIIGLVLGIIIMAIYLKKI